MIHLFEILVPTERPDKHGKFFSTRYHRVWDEKVRAIAGGLSVFKPIKGTWTSFSGEIFKERMITVRVACNQQQMEQIADMTAVYYSQQAIMYYLGSTEVVIKQYGDANG